MPRAPWPPCWASATTTPRRPATGPRATCGWPTTTHPARWSSPGPRRAWRRPAPWPRSWGPSGSWPSPSQAPSTPRSCRGPARTCARPWPRSPSSSPRSVWWPTWTPTCTTIRPSGPGSSRPNSAARSAGARPSRPSPAWA
jgi:hypothetical protein